MGVKNLLLCAVLILSFALSACEANLEKDISLNKMLNGKTAIEMATFDIEVDGCTSSDDKNEPSETVKEAQEKVPNIFANATYQQCYQKDKTFFASFNIPVLVSNLDYASLDKDQNFANAEIILFKVHPNSETLAMAVKDSLAKKFSEAKDNKDFENTDLSITFKIINDTKSVKTIKASDVFIDDLPVLNYESKLPVNASVKMRLADVQTAYLFSDKISHNVVQFLHLDK